MIRFGDGKDIPALQPFSPDIADGEVFGIIGLSGAGKSTLIRLINLLERSGGGRIFVGDTEMTGRTGVAREKKYHGALLPAF